MIGRFAGGLGRHLPATLVAGAILAAMGTWFATDPLRHAYPATSDLEAFEGQAFDAIEVRRRRGAFLRFLVPDPLEFQAVLRPGERIVLYYNSMPGYDAVKAAVGEGVPLTFRLWADAEDEENQLIIWGLDGADGTVVSPGETVAGLKASRASAAWLPGAIAAFGFMLIALGLNARRRNNTTLS